MPTSAAGNSSGQRTRGFTLLELLVVLTILGLVSATLVLSLRDGREELLDREVLRLQAAIETARALARASGAAVVFELRPEGYAFRGLPEGADTEGLDEHRWPAPELQAHLDAGSTAMLGPEPFIPPFQIQLRWGPAVRTLATDGWRSVQSVP
jgi:general secretion pathway protein H